MQQRLIDKIKLENGLTLELYDRSKHAAGDLWLVSFLACMEVGVEREYFEDQDSSNLSFDAIRKAVGDKVTYRYEKTRNFIKETEKDEVLKGLKERFLSATLGYLSSPEFALKLILKKYQDAKGGIQWEGQ